MNRVVRRSALRSSASVWVLAGMVGAGLMSAPGARAAVFDTGNPDFSIRWDNTFQYTLRTRVAPQNNVLLAPGGNLNNDDGDRNFKSGIVADRGDWLSEFDTKIRNYGFSGSFDAWYDAAYNQNNQNNSPGTANNLSVPYNDFTHGTRDAEGRNIQLLNAFIYGHNTIGNLPINWRIGRHTLIWGESLLFPDNGIASGMAPIDVDKQLSIPNLEAQELFMPTNQISFESTLSSKWSVAAYYKLEWRASNLPSAGSYFDSGDILQAGGETTLGDGIYFGRTNDLKAGNSGQFGVAIHYDPNTNWDFGFYGLRYNATTPEIYYNPSGSYVYNPVLNKGEIGTYQLVYPEHIQMYGASASTSVGPVNIAGEMSVRHNMPLVSNVTVTSGEVADNDSNARYAIGDTLHAQASFVYLGDASPLWEGVSFIGEVAGVQVLDIYKNAEAFDTTRTKNALGMRTVITPQYFQVLPGLDLSVPIGLGWNFLGRSPTETGFNGGTDRGGDLSIGVTGLYKNTWQAGLSYTRYIGAPRLTSKSSSNAADTFNALADRDFVSLTLKRAF